MVTRFRCAREETRTGPFQSFEERDREAERGLNLSVNWLRLWISPWRGAVWFRVTMSSSRSRSPLQRMSPSKQMVEFREQQARREDLAQCCVVFRRGTHHDAKLEKDKKSMEILETLDRTAEKKRSLESTVQKTMGKHRTRLEQTCDTPRGSGKTQRSRVMYMADAKRVADIRTECEGARRSWKDAITGWEEAKTKNGGVGRGLMMLAKMQEEIG